VNTPRLQPTARVGAIAAVAVATAVIVAIVFAAQLSAPVRTDEDLTPSGETPAAPPAGDSEVQRERFPPGDLVLLEGPDREEWQKPEQIMDDLGIADGMKVADVGAGSGWFTIRLARAVGPNGVVYAQDLQSEMVTAISRRVNRLGLRNVRVVQGREDDPNLPIGMLDAVLVVDVFPEVDVTKRDEFLKQLAAALKPRGRIGIVNYKPGAGGPGPDSASRVDSALVEQDAKAAGLNVISRRDLGFQYLIVLQGPGEPARGATARGDR
jgi:SAM-dependent methyltransferase